MWKRNPALAWTPALICMGIIFYLSSLPGDEIKIPAYAMSDKVAHFLAYAVLGWLIAFRQYMGKTIRPSNWHDGLGQLIGILYGASDEIHQLFVPLREASLLDWTADGLGIVVGSWICRQGLKKFFGSQLFSQA